MFGQVFKKSKRMVTSCDLFSTTELLRYKENPQFKSANGGLCSIAVIIGFAIIFTQTILNTFDRTSISSQTTLFEESEPTYFSTQDNPFLFALGISGFNLNDNITKYFNIQISQKTTNNGLKTTNYFTLRPCDRAEWLDIDDSLGPAFDNIGLGNWLCLPANTTFEFAGKFTSSLFKYLKISVKDCKATAGDNRTCVNSSIIDAYISKNGPISFNYYFVNAIINSDDSAYLGSYLEDRHYFTFTRTLGTSANIFISSYSILTDNSLWPWTTLAQDTGGIVHESAQRYVFTPTTMPNATEYVSLYLRKSSLSLSVTRSFKKYDDTLSYIGGLFSTFMVCLFFMTKYNEYAYQIEIAAHIYKAKPKALVRARSFHFPALLAYCLYCLLDTLGFPPNWPLMRHFDRVRDEIGKQLDLKLLLRKISFLEESLSYLFDDHELTCLHLKGKMTLKEAEAIRKRFSSRKTLLKLKRKFEAIDPQESQSLDQSKKTFNQSNGQVFDINAVTNIKEGDIGERKVEVREGGGEERREQGEGSESESEDEVGEREALQEYIQSIKQVREEAEHGNKRCKKIYRNLDPEIKCIPQGVRLTEQSNKRVYDTEGGITFQQQLTKEQKELIRNVQFTL